MIQQFQSVWKNGFLRVCLYPIARMENKVVHGHVILLQHADRRECDSDEQQQVHEYTEIKEPRHTKHPDNEQK